MWGALKGKKTYVTAGLAILSTIGGYLTGDLSAVQAIGAVFVAIQTMNLRNALG